MRTPEKWIEWRTANPAVTDDELNRLIQADALFYAAVLCDSQREPKEGEQEDESNGHANRGVENCTAAIVEAARALENPIKEKYLSDSRLKHLVESDEKS